MPTRVSRPKVRVRPGDVRAVLDELGVDYYVQDEEAYLLCPWHDDTRTGSFSINLTTGECHCFACGEGGSLVALVREITGESWSRAQRTVIRSRIGRARTAFTYEEEAPQPRADNDTTKVINEASLVLFTDPPESELRKRSLRLEDCRALGIKWDARRKAWILPIRDPYSGKLLGWQSKGRAGVRNHPGPSSQGAKDGVNKSRALFGLELAGELPRPRRLILVESPLDVARLRAAGIMGGVSSYGVQVSREQLGLIAEFAEELVLALDNDSKGRLVTGRICHGYRDGKGRWHEPWRRLPVWVYEYGLTKAKDPGEQATREIRWGLKNMTSSVRWRSS